MELQKLIALIGIEEVTIQLFMFEKNITREEAKKAYHNFLDSNDLSSYIVPEIFYDDLDLCPQD